jgi:hypothetical protein
MTKIYSTRIEGLKYFRDLSGNWRIVDCHDAMPTINDEPKAVGPLYKTQIELLADFDRYARESWGYR